MKNALKRLLKAEWEFMLFCIRTGIEVQEEFDEHVLEEEKEK